MQELTSKYVRMNEEDAKDLWTGLYEASAQCCMHGANCAQGMDCQVCLPKPDTLSLLNLHS